jgi:hypothetical protein
LPGASVTLVCPQLVDAMTANPKIADAISVLPQDTSSGNV